MRFLSSLRWAVLPGAALLAAAGYAPAPSNSAVVADFSQGVIATRVSLPGNPFDKLLSRVDATKGNVQEQLQQLAGSLSVAEQQQLQAAAASASPAMTMGAFLLPRKGTLYCRGQEGSPPPTPSRTTSKTTST